MLKKILTISTVVLFIAVLGLAYYYFFFSGKSATTNTPTGNTQSNGNLFPFGEGGTNPVTTQNTSTTTAQSQQTQPVGDYLQKLRLISGEPVSGATFMENTKGVTIRYMEKATGHIFDVPTYAAGITRISNTTIPRIYETFFTEGGQSFIARYIGDDGETIETVYGKIASTSVSQNTTATTSAITGTLLPSNIKFLVVSPSGKNIFYVQKSDSGSTGIIASPNGAGKKQIWQSVIGGVLPQFATENQIIITTSPNTTAPGYAYAVDVKTAGVKNILGQISDLSTLVNPAGDKAIFWSAAGRGQLSQYSIKSATTTQITPTTFPEKCVFDPNNKNVLYCAVPRDLLGASSLDNWYLGLQSFSDDIWKYDLSQNTSRMIENLSSDSGRAIDAIDLHINSAGSLLLFQSKTDGSLWSLNVSGN